MAELRIAHTIVGLALSFAYGLSLWCLWGWFVVPLGVPDIGYWHALGLCLFGSLFTILGLTPQALSGSNEIEVNIAMAVAKLIATLLTTGLGWLVHFGVA